MSAYAKVRLTFEATFNQPWSEDEVVKNIREQAARNARDFGGKAAIALQENGIASRSGVTVKLVDIGEVVVVIAPEGK